MCEYVMLINEILSSYACTLSRLKYFHTTNLKCITCVIYWLSAYINRINFLNHPWNTTSMYYRRIETWYKHHHYIDIWLFLGRSFLLFKCSFRTVLLNQNIWILRELYPLLGNLKNGQEVHGMCARFCFVMETKFERMKQ